MAAVPGAYEPEITRDRLPRDDGDAPRYPQISLKYRFEATFRIAESIRNLHSLADMLALA